LAMGNTNAGDALRTTRTSLARSFPVATSSFRLVVTC
jgi:hypothetical protein